MKFGVLGPLHVVTDRGAVRLAGDRQRKVMATLLISYDRVVSLPRLVDAVWGEDPPATAKRQIQNSMSALRRRLAEDGAGRPAIVADGNGYRIPRAAGDFDLQTFEDWVARARQLVAAGDGMAAVRELRGALALWRGHALQGLTGRVFESAAIRMNEQRLVVTEECLELELRLGGEHRVIGELTELVAAHPLREGPARLLMLALHWSGRQADALNTYHNLRARLANELALDPSASLRELSVAILNDDPSASAPDGREAVIRATPRSRASRLPVPAQLPADVAGFTGRTERLAELDRAGPISVISGMAGVGKTALAVHWGHGVRGHFPDGQLYVNLRGFDPAGPSVSAGEALRGFLDALAVPPEQIPAGLGAQAALYRSLLADRRMLVVLDNARDANHVRPLLPGSPTCRVVVTSRSRLSGLIAGEGAHPLSLDLLCPAEAREMLVRRLGRDRVQAAPVGVEEIIARCAGLPLALAIVGARAVNRPALPLDALVDELREGWDGLDAFDGEDAVTDVRAVFSWSYQALSPAAARLFRLLALHPGPDLSAAAATSLAAAANPAAASPSTAGTEARRALAELVAAHLVVETVPRRYTMHDLLRRYATELVGRIDSEAERRAAVRRVLDHYLHSAYVAARGQHPQRHPITLPGPPPGIAPERLTGQDEALAWFTAEHAVLLSAMKQAARAGRHGHAWQLAWTVAEFLDQRGHWYEAVDIQRDAVRAARRAADPAGQAHASRALGRAHLRLHRAADAGPALRSAFALFERLGETAALARTHLDLAWLCDLERRFWPALEHAEQALGLFRAIGDPAGQADALNAAGSYRALLGEHGLALDICRRALALHQELGYQRGHAATWVRLGHINRQTGDHEEAARCFRLALELFREIGVRYDEAAALVALGDTQDAANDRDAARRSWQQALTILTELQHSEAEQVRARLRRVAVAVAT